MGHVDIKGYIMEGSGKFIVFFGAALLVTPCGCGKRAAPNFVSAKITCYYSVDPPGDGMHPERSTTLITDAETVQRLAAFFPHAGQGKTTWIGTGWESFAKILFVRPNGDTVKVAVSYDLKDWAEKGGDWSIKDPKKFRTFFLELVKKSDAPEPDSPPVENE